jgi:hypothetical protein
LRRIKLLLAVVAALSMLMAMSAPAMANDWGWDHTRDFDGHNFDGHKDFDGNGLFLNDFEDFDDDDDDDDDDDFFTFDDCAWVASFDDQVLILCDA